MDTIAITLSELEDAYARSQKITPNITREEVLDTLVNRVLLLREAKKIRIEVPSEDELLKEYIDLRIRPFIKIKDEDIVNFYQSHIQNFQGREFEEVREEIENYFAERELNELLRIHIQELRKRAYIRIQLTEEP